MYAKLSVYWQTFCEIVPNFASPHDFSAVYGHSLHPVYTLNCKSTIEYDCIVGQITFYFLFQIFAPQVLMVSN